MSRPQGTSRYSSWRDPNGPLQKRLLRFIDEAAHKGMTVREAYGLFSTNPASAEYAHHGWISGALSTLHGDLSIVRLSERRDGCKVYVHPDYLDGRTCEAQGRGGLSKQEAVRLQSLDNLLEYWMQVDTEGSRFGTDRTKAERNQALFFRELKGMYRSDL